MKKNKRIIKLVAGMAIIFLFLLIKFPSIFAGILYPKVEFSIFPVDTEDGDDKSSVVIHVWRGQFTEFKQPVRFSLRANKQYERIYVKEIAYEFEGKSGIYAKDFSIGLRWSKSTDYEGWYIDTTMLRFINLRKIFRGKNPGEDFDFRWIITYHYDDEPEQTVVVECTASAIKGTLRLPIPVIFFAM